MEFYRLIFYPNKSKSMLFTTQQMVRRHQLDYSLRTTDGKEIERVLNFKLLGVTFNENLKWNTYVKKATASAYGSLKTLTRLKRFLPFLFSRLDYCNTLLFNAPAYLQRVQNSAASFVRGRYSTQLDVARLNWLPVVERSSCSIAKLA